MGVSRVIRVVIVSMYFKGDRKIALEYGATRILNLWRGERVSTRTELRFGVGGMLGDTLVIGSSEQVHVVDALAITGDEGRGSLRKATGSWQTSFDPSMSEWGNPALLGHPELNT
jgi:hypothetical protein